MADEKKNTRCFTCDGTGQTCATCGESEAACGCDEEDQQFIMCADCGGEGD